MLNIERAELRTLLAHYQVSHQNEKDTETAQRKQVFNGENKIPIFSKWSAIGKIKLAKLTSLPVTESDAALGIGRDWEASADQKRIMALLLK